MALKDTWVDKKDGVDINSADDINQVAHADIELEEKGGATGGGLNTEAANLLIYILKCATYTEDVSYRITRLSEILGDNTDDGGIVVQSVKLGSTSYSNNQLTVSVGWDARATLIPIGQYLEKGKTYKFSLGSIAGTYLYGVQIMVADSAGKTFPYTGTAMNYSGVTERIIDTGYITADYTYTPDRDNCILAVNFSKSGGASMGESDYITLAENFTIEMSVIPDEPVVPDEPDEPEVPDIPDEPVEHDEPYDTVVVSASVTATSGTAQGVELGNYNNGYRATLLASDGVVKLPITVSGDMTNYSLIRIPIDTEKATIIGGAEFTFGVQIFELMNGTKFQIKVDSGWIDMTGNKYVYDIADTYSDGNHYIAVNFKKDDASVFDVESYKDIFSMYFGDVEDSGNTGGNTGDNGGSGDDNSGVVSAVLISAGISNPTGTEIQLANYNNGQRATLVTTDGDIKLSIAVTNETTDYSLIKIPANATTFAFTGSAVFNYGIGIFAVENAKYSQKVDSGWIDMTSDSGEYAIASEYADGNHYISANFKKDDAGVFDVESYKDIITAKFKFA